MTVFCKDCVHFDASAVCYPAGFGGCMRPTGGVSPVDGSAYRLGERALVERAYKPGLIFNRNRCGPEGRFFTPPPEMGDYRFEAPLWELLDAGLSEDKAKAAKLAVSAESRNWCGSLDWEGVAAALVNAALKAVAGIRSGKA